MEINIDISELKRNDLPEMASIKDPELMRSVPEDMESSDLNFSEEHLK